jgi:succinate dehydrogenase/fumarate reductase flavoprotein subunit
VALVDVLIVMMQTQCHGTESLRASSFTITASSSSKDAESQLVKVVLMHRQLGGGTEIMPHGRNNVDGLAAAGCAGRPQL